MKTRKVVEMEGYSDRSVASGSRFATHRSVFMLGDPGWIAERDSLIHLKIYYNN
jgi:hypothetical protein